MQLTPPLQSCLPDFKASHRKDCGIGIIGAGGIVSNIHLPGYLKAGYRVAGVYDLNYERTRELVERNNCGQAYESLDALLADDAVEVVDIAVPGAGRMEIVEKVVAAGKPILIQKPLNDDWKSSLDLARVLAGTTAPVGVNQNARVAPEYAFIANLVNEGLLGEVYFGQHLLFSNFDSLHHAPWHTQLPIYQMWQYGIHHFDVLRQWLGGLPERVHAITARRPDQQFRGDMFATVHLDFGKDVTGFLEENNYLHGKRAGNRSFEVHGSRGYVRGEGYGNPLEVYAEGVTKEPLEVTLDGSWFPGSFVYLMGDLMDAVAEKRAPVVTVRDHLLSLAIVECAYRSADEGRWVRMNEITSEIQTH